MQIIKQITLLYQSGRSDKLYEVDLAKTGDDQYVVNFRYGRRGASLKEGSKTVAALPLVMAQRVFDQLVASKIRKGYVNVTDQALPEAVESPQSPIVSCPAPTDPNQRNQAILDRLFAAVSGSIEPIKNRKLWALGRVIWRSGELKLNAAAPLLVQLLGRDPLQNYSIAWALGYCGNDSAIAPLEALYRNPSTPEHVRRISLEALFKLVDEPKGEALKEELRVMLPPPLRRLLREGTSDQWLQTFNETVEKCDRPQDLAVIEMLYQINHEASRPALLEFIRTAPFAPPYFQRLRHLYKIAEYRQDATFWGALAYRFEQESSTYSSEAYQISFPNGDRIYRHHLVDDRTRHWDYNPDQNYIQQEQQSPKTRLAFSNKTQQYFRRRIWRYLHKLGQLDDPHYVQLASELLLQYTDTDAEPSRESVISQYNWHSGAQTVRRSHWDIFAGFITLNHILYENSPRYILKPSGRAWQCKSPYKPGDPKPEGREEAFPTLWEANPQALLRLLLESQCQIVHEFAVQAIKASREFCQTLSIETLILLLSRGYEVTAAFGFELARDRYTPNNPNHELVLAIANCSYTPARLEAHQWIANQADQFISNGTLITSLLLSKFSDTRACIRAVLSRALITDTVARSLLGQAIAQILTLDTIQPEVITDISETLQLCFAPQLRQLGLEIVVDLLRHSLPEIQEFGARILLNHETPVVDLPDGLLDALLESPYDPVRVIGVRLLGQLPDSLLIQRIQLLMTLATHEQKEMREAIRPTIQRLAAQTPDFCDQIGPPMLQVLGQAEPHEGIHSFVVQLFTTGFTSWMARLSPDLAWQLLEAEASAAHDVAGQILQANVSQWSPKLTTAEIAALTHHEVLAVRQAGQQMLDTILPRLRQSSDELLAAVVVLESKWQDARDFGFGLFRDRLQPEDFTPAIVISICDNTNAEVRKLGRELVSRCFQDQDSQSYLLKFSEHPSVDMQLFATQYLSDHVAENLSLLQELAPYFTRVLGQVNRGRVTKQRIFKFLETEAIKSEGAAEVVSEILTRQSATIAIGDRSQCLAILLKIHRHYPQLSLPITVKPIAVRQVS